MSHIDLHKISIYFTNEWKPKFHFGELLNIIEKKVVLEVKLSWCFSVLLFHSFDWQSLHVFSMLTKELSTDLSNKWNHSQKWVTKKSSRTLSSLYFVTYYMARISIREFTHQMLFWLTKFYLADEKVTLD